MIKVTFDLSERAAFDVEASFRELELRYADLQREADPGLGIGSAAWYAYHRYLYKRLAEQLAAAVAKEKSSGSGE